VLNVRFLYYVLALYLMLLFAALILDHYALFRE